MEEQIIRTEYSELMQKSYIDYAMSVIIARALPDVRDGLKPDVYKRQAGKPGQRTGRVYGACSGAVSGLCEL